MYTNSYFDYMVYCYTSIIQRGTQKKKVEGEKQEAGLREERDEREEEKEMKN